MSELTFCRILETEYGYNESRLRPGPPSSFDDKEEQSLRNQLFGNVSDNAGDPSMKVVDEVDRFCVMVVPPDTSIIAWFHAQKGAFPYHFLASEKHSITASSTAVERANSEAGREFTKFRMSLSAVMFKVSMCARSWKKVLKIPTDRRAAVKDLEQLNEMVEDLLLEEDFEEEILEEGSVPN